MENPYTFNIPTETIYYLYNLLIMYDNPLSVLDDPKKNYLMIDRTKFNPFHKNPMNRFVLFVSDDLSGNLDIYSVNMGANFTLVSLQEAVNKIDIVFQQERVQNFLSYMNIKYPIDFSIYNINQLKDYKTAVSNILNLPGPLFNLDNDLILGFNSFNMNKDKGISTSLTNSYYFNPENQKWCSDIFKYDIANGILIGLVMNKPIFSINVDELLTFNNVFYLPDNENNRCLVGGSGNYTFIKKTDSTAEICRVNELQYQQILNPNFSLLEYRPFDDYYEIICFPDNRGKFYMWGVVGFNNDDNFYILAQGSWFIEQINTMVFTFFNSNFVSEKLPTEPTFDFDGFIIWFEKETENFLVYEPTFPEFLLKHTLSRQGVQDLRY